MIDCSIDIWSFGISLYKLAVAYFPNEVKEYKYDSGLPIPFLPRDWKNIDIGLKDLIKDCLVYDPSKRITAKEALNHYWFHD